VRNSPKDKSVIPYGPYCYDKNGICPYWCKLEGFLEQENGYCEYLGYGDYQINEKKNLVNWKSDGMVFREGKYSGHEVGIPVGLLWDQCKECEINDEK